jgi:hypothetical protein
VTLGLRQRLKAIDAELRRRSPILHHVAVVLLVTVPIMVAFAAADSRTVMGVNPWIKPIKFSLSMAIYAATFGWLLEYLQFPPRKKRRLAGTVAATLIIEIVSIGGQAARGIQSHYNLSSEFNAMIFAFMGLAITVNTVIAAYVGVKFWTSAPPIPRPYLWGIRFGLAIFVLASLEGFAMAGRLGHNIGVADGGAGLPFVNWSTRGGDLRTSHFLGMHALQVLPFCGYLFSRAWPEERAGAHGRYMIAVSAGYGALVLLLFLQALAGRPLL